MNARTRAKAEFLANLPPAMRSMEQRLYSRMKGQNGYIREMAVETGEVAPGVEYWITENPVTEMVRKFRLDEASGELPKGFCEGQTFLMNQEGNLNGYVAFPKRRAPLRIERFHRSDIVEFIPVHGGVTYANKDRLAAVWGFDTSHYYSGHMPAKERPWIAWQCRVLYEGLMLAASIERRYRRATPHQKAELLRPLVNLVPEEELGTGALIALLGGLT